MSLEDHQLEAYRQLRTSQDKYVYFLLAAAGACIGFALSQTQQATISWSKLPLGAAVLCWGSSFFFGCRHLLYVNANLFTNTELLRVIGRQHPETGDHPQLINAAAQGMSRAIEANDVRSNRLAKLQFSSLITGAVFYVGWHVWEMWLRSKAFG